MTGTPSNNIFYRVAKADNTCLRSESASPSAGDEDAGGLTLEQRLEKQRLEYAEDDDEEPNQLAQQQPLLEAAVSVPNIPAPKPSDGQVSYTKPYMFKLNHIGAHS